MYHLEKGTLSEYYKMRGPLLLLAGPGTGKTYNLIHRVKYLIEEEEVLPENIAVITFTAAAARSLRKRISDRSQLETFLTSDRQPKIISTMHSLGHRIISENAEKVGLSDKIRLIHDDYTRDLLLQDAAQLVGYERGDAKGASIFRQSGKREVENEKISQICNQYESVLRSCSCVDHDDQILLAVKILNDDDSIAALFRDKCMHLLIDEYQDINQGQFDLIKLLSAGNENGLFVVGDDDQSIYSWRGGSPDYIRNFEELFGNDASIQTPIRSYRCHPHILEGAFEIVKKHDVDRLDKGKIEYENEAGNKIQIHNVPSDRGEASIVASIIQSNLPQKSALILVPHKGFTASIRAELSRRNIPFTAPLKLPGKGLPILKVLSYWLKDKSDSISFRVCLDAYLNSKDSGIPSRRSRKTEKKLERETSLKLIADLWKNVIDKEANSLWDALDSKKNDNDLYEQLYDTFTEIDSLYQKNDQLSEFSDGVMRILEPWNSPKALLEEIELWIEHVEKPTSGFSDADVSIMTLQGAKGLEADIVCILGLEEGTVPRTDSESSLEEQSRLMFVSMTRAKEELHLFHARTRSGSTIFRDPFASKGTPDINPSRFFDSIPTDHKDIVFHPPKK